MSRFKDPCPQISRDEEHIKQRRNYLLRKRFFQLFEKEDIRYDRAIERLAYDEFFLQERTVELIVKYQGAWKNDEVVDFNR